MRRAVGNQASRGPCAVRPGHRAGRVVHHQNALRAHACVREDAAVILRALLPLVDEVRAVKSIEKAARAHSRQIAIQLQGVLPGRGE